MYLVEPFEPIDLSTSQQKVLHPVYICLVELLWTAPPATLFSSSIASPEIVSHKSETQKNHSFINSFNCFKPTSRRQRMKGMRAPTNWDDLNLYGYPLNSRITFRITTIIIDIIISQARFH